MWSQIFLYFSHWDESLSHLLESELCDYLTRRIWQKGSCAIFILGRCYYPSTKTGQREYQKKRPVSFLNIDALILNKGNYVSWPSGLHQEYKPGLIFETVIHHINRLRKKNSYNHISWWKRKASDKIQHLFLVKKKKNSQKSRNRIELLNLVRSIYKQSSSLHGLSWQHGNGSFYWRAGMEVLAPWQVSLISPCCGGWGSVLQPSERVQDSHAVVAGVGKDGAAFFFFSCGLWLESNGSCQKKCSVFPGGHLPSALVDRADFH